MARLSCALPDFCLHKGLRRVESRLQFERLFPDSVLRIPHRLPILEKGMDLVASGVDVIRRGGGDSIYPDEQRCHCSAVKLSIKVGLLFRSDLQEEEAREEVVHAYRSRLGAAV